jgi:hypothetical protein
MAGGMAAGAAGGKSGGGGGYSNQTAATATGKQDGMFNDSGFVVNFKSSGNASASTGASNLPGWFVPALAIGAVVWLTRKH